MSEFTEINNAFWNDHFKIDNKTRKEIKQFWKEMDEGLHPFIYNGKKWKRSRSDYKSNSGKTFDSTITFVAEDGETISIESNNKYNRRHTLWKK
jgi:hypothetical protein|tara:strand:- start:135 stop:416 length:282 start_codon:yes stop_codon:yes gene_type:complete